MSDRISDAEAMTARKVLRRIVRQKKALDEKSRRTRVVSSKQPWTSRDTRKLIHASVDPFWFLWYGDER